MPDPSNLTNLSNGGTFTSNTPAQALVVASNINNGANISTCVAPTRAGAVVNPDNISNVSGKYTELVVRNTNAVGTFTNYAVGSELAIAGTAQVLGLTNYAANDPAVFDGLRGDPTNDSAKAAAYLSRILHDYRVIFNQIQIAVPVGSVAYAQQVAARPQLVQLDFDGDSKFNKFQSITCNGCLANDNAYYILTYNFITPADARYGIVIPIYGVGASLVSDVLVTAYISGVATNAEYSDPQGCNM